MGNIAAAQNILALGLQRHPLTRHHTGWIARLLGIARNMRSKDRNFALAAMEIALARRAGDRDIADHLAALHADTGLAGLALAPGDAPRFDRLCLRKAPRPVEHGPKVSVVLPVHDAEDTLPACLSGLTAQSWRNLEIIVVDDASTDRTVAVAQSFALKDPRIRLIRLPVNNGAYVARNTGFEAATGEYLTVHDADDWSHPQKIEEQVRPFLKRQAPKATVSHWIRVDDNLRMTRWRMEDGWIHRNVSSLMFRSGLRDSLGYWDRVRTNADTEYYHRLLAAFGAEAVNEVREDVPLSFGRTRSGSLTTQGATHLATQFAGVRRRYMDAAHDWHRRRIETLPPSATPDERAGALHLSMQPERRPFIAPAETGPADRYEPDDDYGRAASSRYLNRNWYLRRNPDVLMADADPVAHYLERGTAENRDPGPLFPNAAWHRLADIGEDTVPLLAMEAGGELAARHPRFSGALEQAERPVVLVFAHAAEQMVFGAERSLLTTLERLAKGYGGTRFAPVVVLPSAANHDYLEQVRAHAIAVEILPQVWRHRFRAAPQVTIEAIRGLIRRYRPQEVHINTIVLDTPLIAARLEGCACVVHVRELPAQDAGLCSLLGDTPQGLRRRLLVEADRFIANSPDVADWIGCPDRTALWPNAIDATLFDEPFSPGESLRVAMVSSNIAKKGIADFMQVAERVAGLEAGEGVPKARRCRFRLIGPSSADLAALAPFPGNVEHAGYAAGAVAAMRGCDLVLILSRFAESFGRTALEAMAAGRPVISYDRGNPPRLIDNGRSGVVVAADDPAAVAQAIMALATARGDLMQMSDKARSSAARFAGAAETGR